MGVESLQRVCGIEVFAAPSSSVKNCMVPGDAAHGRFQAAAECLLWKNVRQGERRLLITMRNSYRPQGVQRKRRNDLLVSPCTTCCSSTFTSSSPMFEGDGRNQNGAGASSSSVMQSTLLRLHNSGIIACLRTTRADVALDAARAALDGGLTVVEVTMTTPSAAAVIESLAREYPSATIGAGTVLSVHEAETAKQAGAQFLTSPVTVEIIFDPLEYGEWSGETLLQDMVRAHRDGPVLFIPGAMTPTEVVSAYSMGAHAVKLFPMALLGDIRFVLALRKTLGHIPLIPSNGISIDMVESYFDAGVMAVIVSDAVFDKAALECRNFGRIRTLASFAATKSLSGKISTK